MHQDSRSTVLGHAVRGVWLQLADGRRVKGQADGQSGFRIVWYKDFQVEREQRFDGMMETYHFLDALTAIAPLENWLPYEEFLKGRKMPCPK
jgi:hypothetical protein